MPPPPPLEGGGSSKCDGGELKSKQGSIGELKMLSKIPVKEFI